MPIDDMFLKPILDVYRNMVEDCVKQNIQGEYFDKMCEVLSRMVHLGQEHSDFNAFNAQIMNENLYGKFSDYYGKSLSSQATEMYKSKGDYDDGSLLKSCLDGLKQAIVAIEKGYQDAIALASKEGDKNGMAKEIEILQNPEPLILPIQNLIALGEQDGMTLPDFLRIQIEEGLDKLAEGGVASKEALVFEQEYTNAIPATPFHLQRINEKIEAYNELCSAYEFGVPDWKEWQFKRDDIDRKFVGDIKKFEYIISMWENLLDDLAHWSLSYTSFAPYIDPWKGAKDPIAATIKTQNVQPGIFKEREKLFKKYFGLNFMDIFCHPTFIFQVQYDYFTLSQVFTEFLIENIYQECLPYNHLSKEFIAERGSYSMFGPTGKDKEMNPGIHRIHDRMKEFYDKRFGEGRYEFKYGKPDPSKATAPFWDLKTFKYKP